MERFIEIDGTKIWTISEGQGLPLIICNGGPGCDDYLQPVSAMLEDQCQIIRWEPRGCGRSDYDGRYDLGTTVQDLEYIRQAYQLAQIILLGHSAGPDIALAYTLKYSERVSGIIGIAGGRIINDREWSATYKKNKIERGELADNRIWKADPAVNKIGVQSWRAYIKRPRLLKELTQIKVPAIFINAGADIRPNWPTEQLANLIPKGIYKEISEADHSIWLTHPEALKKELLEAVSIIQAAKF